MPLPEMAVRYVLGLEGITGTLVGVDSVAQMRENLVLFKKGSLPPYAQERIAALVPILPDIILKPTLWPKTQSS
jgi:aryl-alcohol dehydrogenase-like predicted oxidoreductase